MSDNTLAGNSENAMTKPALLADSANKMQELSDNFRSRLQIGKLFSNLALAATFRSQKISP